VEMGGSLGRREATGRGCMFVTREALAKLGMRLKGARVAVARFRECGFPWRRPDGPRKVRSFVAVSDKLGWRYQPAGLDIPEMLKWVKEHRQLAAIQGEPISKEALLTVECDVLVPAATENVITRKKPHIKAKIIWRRGERPTTAAADEILEKKGIFVIPDISRERRRRDRELLRVGTGPRRLPSGTRTP